MNASAYTAIAVHSEITDHVSNVSAFSAGISRS
jgi:hypothetical protein